jgi:hypothetical protein
MPYHHKAHEGHEGFGNYYISISYFVLFATFVVKSLFRFWLRLRRSRTFVVKNCLFLFGCGSAALGLGGEYLFIGNPEVPKLKAKEHNFHVLEMLEIPKCPNPDPRHGSSSIGNVLSVLYPTASEENRVQDEMPAVPT